MELEDKLKQVLSANSKVKVNGMSLDDIVIAFHDGQLFSGITNKDIRSHINKVVKEKDGYIIKASKKEKGTGRVLYKLRPAKGPNLKKRQKPETDVFDTNIIGKAGEMAVISELLYCGYTANTMIVDKGIDVVASMNNKFYYIQVKTTYLDENGKCSISIPRASFERVESLYNVSYIIVIRSGVGEHSFLVFTQNQIEHWIQDKYIERTDANVNIKLIYDELDKQPYLYNDRYRVKVSSYLNNFKLA